MTDHSSQKLNSLLSSKQAHTELEISGAERRAVSLLVVEPDNADAASLRSGIKNLGYGYVYGARDYHQAIKLVTAKNFTHILFSAKSSNFPADKFLKNILDIEEAITAIPSSYSPVLDDVFSLLQIGARGFLAKPFTMHSLDQAVITATKLPPLPSSLLTANDRNAAFAASILGDLDRLTRALRQARKFPSAERELPLLRARLIKSVEIAKLFVEGSQDELVESIVEATMNIAEGPASRLGRLRKKLLTMRGDGHEESELEDDEEEFEDE